MYDHVFQVDMANTILSNILLRHVAPDYLTLKSITSKLQGTASSIVFIIHDIIAS